MKIKAVTNESFEKYIDVVMKKNRTLLERYRSKNEGRWDSLDLDDVAADVNVPSQGESNDAIRELDFMDAVAVATNTEPEITDNGVRWLDLDDEKPVSKSDMQDRIRELDFDPTGSPNKDGDDGKVRELDFDPKGGDIKTRKSNLGVLGKLDIDDADFSSVVANADELYAALANDNAKEVASIVKKYATDIDDDKRISDIMLAQAINHNLPCLKILCGNMKFTVSAKEKALGFVNREDVTACLARLKEIASKLTGEGNTYGLVPNAIVSCKPDDQIKCINTIDFLIKEMNMPIEPMFVRGAMTLKCYDLAEFLLNELEKPFELALLTGTKGLVNRIKNHDNIPAALLDKIIARIDKDINIAKLNYQLAGGLAITCANNGNKKSGNKLVNAYKGSKRDLIIDYIDDESATALDALGISKE